MGRRDPILRRQSGGSGRGGGRLGREHADYRGRDGEPGERIELAGLPDRSAGARPAWCRVRGVGRSRRPEEGDPGGVSGSRMAAVLCSFSSERAGLRAAQGGRRLPEGAALDVRPARLEGGPAGSGGVAGENGRASTPSCATGWKTTWRRRWPITGCRSGTTSI